MRQSGYNLGGRRSRFYQGARRWVLTVQTESPDLFELVARLSAQRAQEATHEDIFYCFRLLLGRDPHPEEVIGHMAVAGRPLADVVANFLNSTEFTERRLVRPRPAEEPNGETSPEDIFYCFRLLLGRTPCSEELTGHMAVVGAPLSEVVATFLNSAEFDVRELAGARTDGALLFERDGYSMYVDPNDQAVGRVMAAGAYEPHVFATLQRLVRPGDTVVDIGANIGSFALFGAHLVGADGRVVAIEPNPANCRLIEASRAHNGFDHLEVHAVAASRANGALALHAAWSNGSVSGLSENIATLMRSQIVQGMRLDDLLQLDRLDFVKIDVEGFELDALMGFRRHLRRFRPIIVSEFAPGMMHDPKGYIGFLQALGYRISVIRDDGTPEDVGQDADAIIRAQKNSPGDHVDILATPGRWANLGKALGALYRRA
jgi:FkbM family methyltransferase